MSSTTSAALPEQAAPRGLKLREIFRTSTSPTNREALPTRAALHRNEKKVREFIDKALAEYGLSVQELDTLLSPEGLPRALASAITYDEIHRAVLLTEYSQGFQVNTEDLVAYDKRIDQALAAITFEDNFWDTLREREAEPPQTVMGKAFLSALDSRPNGVGLSPEERSFYLIIRKMVLVVLFREIDKEVSKPEYLDAFAAAFDTSPTERVTAMKVAADKMRDAVQQLVLEKAKQLKAMATQEGLSAPDFTQVPVALDPGVSLSFDQLVDSLGDRIFAEATDVQVGKINFLVMRQIYPQMANQSSSGIFDNRFKLEGTRRPLLMLFVVLALLFVLGAGAVGAGSSRIEKTGDDDTAGHTQPNANKLENTNSGRVAYESAFGEPVFTYRVQQGDTLGEIIRKYKHEAYPDASIPDSLLQELMVAWNFLPNEDTISEGQELQFFSLD